MGETVDSVGLTLALAAALIVPGGLALAAAGRRESGWLHSAMAVGVSVALWPLVLLWTSVVGWVWHGTTVRAALVLACAAAGHMAWRRRAGPWRPTPTGVAVVSIVAVALLLRAVQASDVVVPPWVDGYHHTVVTRLFVLRGGVPADLQPYLAVEPFYYHFGFHAVAAAVGMAAGSGAAATTLWVGQALNGVAALTVAALAWRLTGSGPAAAAAAAIPAALYYFPSYFLTWGRYTQLTGLVVLPVAWILLADAVRSDRATAGRAIALAAAVSGGLLLVHYRVFVFYLTGAAVMATGIAVDRQARRLAWRWLAAIGAVTTVLVAPWVLGRVVPGTAALAASVPERPWYAADATIGEVPTWLLTIGTNRWWLGLAALGVVLGLVRHRRATLAVLAGLGAALVAVSPPWLGLPATWTLPPFSLAISLYLPAALGVGLLVTVVTCALGELLEAEDRVERAALVLALLATAAGAWRLRTIVNPVTVIATPADLAAAEWIRLHTPREACFLVSTGHWQLGTYRGLDGGYWLPLTAGRRTTMPAALYPYGEPKDVREINEFSARSAAATDAPSVVDRMREVGATYAYVGPQGGEIEGKLDADELAQHPALETVYAHDGVSVLRLRATDRGGRHRAAAAGNPAAVCPRVPPPPPDT
jgi:hypothetical protein